MPSRSPVTTMTAESEDTRLQVEVTIPLSSRRSGANRPKQIPTDWPDQSRTPRITRLMALAIKLQAMVENGQVDDYAAVARLGCVTRARLTQIMNLLLLAPDIQEYLLWVDFRAKISERHLRRLVRLPNWHDQRRIWEHKLRSDGLIQPLPYSTEAGESAYARNSRNCAIESHGLLR